MAIDYMDSVCPLIRSEEQLFRVSDAAIQFFDDYGKAGKLVNTLHSILL